MTGTQISEHNFQNEPLNVLCIEDGAGYATGHIYCADDGGILRDIFQAHTHLNSATGGTLYDIYKVNYNEMIQMDHSINISINDFMVNFNGSGTAVNVDDNPSGGATKYIQATTGTAADNYVNLVAGGGRIFFGKPLTLQLKYNIQIDTNVNYRMGCGQPSMQNAAGTTAQLGFEGCTSGPSPTLNGAYSADGTTRTTEYLSAMVQSVPIGLRIDYLPGSKIIAMDGYGAIVNKTSNLPPISSATNSNSTFKAGVKATAVSSSRWLKLYAMRLVGGSYDSQSGIHGWI